MCHQLSPLTRKITKETIHNLFLSNPHVTSTDRLTKLELSLSYTLVGQCFVSPS